ncbi:hypothetical protein ACLB2K_077547 [Fragaria x ananassa]
MLVVRPDVQIAEVWDSLGCSRRLKNQCKTILQALDMIYGSVEFTMKPFGQEKKKFADFTLNEPAHSPKQEGGADCGIFTIKHMQNYGTKWWHEVMICLYTAHDLGRPMSSNKWTYPRRLIKPKTSYRLSRWSPLYYYRFVNRLDFSNGKGLIQPYLFACLITALFGKAYFSFASKLSSQKCLVVNKMMGFALKHLSFVSKSQSRKKAASESPKRFECTVALNTVH